MKLWMKIFIGLFVGIVLGVLVRNFVPEESVRSQIFLCGKIVGDLFMKLIKMTLPLLLLSSMIVGVTSIPDSKKLGRVGTLTLVMFLFTTLCAILVAFSVAFLLKPGSTMHLTYHPDYMAPDASLGSILFNMIPSNPVAAMVNENSLQIILFACFLGFAINAAGEKGEPVLKFFRALALVMTKLIGVVMHFAPFGIAGIIFWVTGTFGTEILHALFKFLGAIYAASLIHITFVFGSILLLGRLNPLIFLRGMWDAILLAFSSSSSSATLPVSLDCVQKNLGVSGSMANFVLPLGATINMNGTAIFQALAVVFVAQGYEIDLSLQQFVVIIITTTLCSIGTSGSPGSGVLILGTILSAVGLPLEALGLIWGIDRLRDMIGTVVNILGDGIVAVYLAKREGELNEELYYK